MADATIFPLCSWSRLLTEKNWRGKIMIREGMFIADRYEVLGKIGAGGMSDVYKAKDQVLGRFVAIKVLKQEFSEDTTFVSKFHAEASSAAGLEHPNIVNVYDVGSEDGMYYIVMECIEGVTLKTYIEKKGQLNYKEAISIAIQVGRGIEAAHMKQIIHRDIKPQNIMISTDGKVKVTDFGIARAASSNTIHSDVMGSVHYSSPEQARNGFVDHKSDIYSLGIVMYEMVTGRVPFDGDTAVAVAIQHLQEDMIPPSKYAPDLPANLEKIILKCTQKSPDRRYQSMADLLVDLKRALINPEEDFVTLEAAAVAGATKVIREDEVNEIKRQANQILTPDISRERETPKQKQVEMQSQKPAQKQKSRRTRDWEEDELEEPYYDEEGYEDDGYEYEEGEFYDDDEYEDEEEGGVLRPGMEKVVTILGIVAAVVIGIIIIYLLINLFGKMPGKSNDATTETETQTETELTTESETAEEPAGPTDGVAMIELRGMTFDQAKTTLNDMGLGIFLVGYQSSDEFGKDQIVSQDVEPGTTVPANTTVKVYVSSGKGELSVPDVSGQDFETAKATLEGAGFEVNKVEEYSSSVEEGKVISTTPAAGAAAKAGDTITVKVSTGEEPEQNFVMPNYSGQDQTTVVSELQNNYGCKVTVNQEYNTTYAAGKVIATSPTAGSAVQKGSEVLVAVSKGGQTYAYSANVSVPSDAVVSATYKLTDANGNTLVGDTTVSSFTTNADGTRSFAVTANNLPTPTGQLYITWALSDGSTQNNATYPIAVTFAQTN